MTTIGVDTFRVHTTRSLVETFVHVTAFAAAGGVVDFLVSLLAVALVATLVVVTFRVRTTDAASFAFVHVCSFFRSDGQNPNVSEKWLIELTDTIDVLRLIAGLATANTVRAERVHCALEVRRTGHVDRRSFTADIR